MIEILICPGQAELEQGEHQGESECEDGCQEAGWYCCQETVQANLWSEQGGTITQGQHFCPVKKQGDVWVLIRILFSVFFCLYEDKILVL